MHLLSPWKSAQLLGKNKIVIILTLKLQCKVGSIPFLSENHEKENKKHKNPSVLIILGDSKYPTLT